MTEIPTEAERDYRWLSEAPEPTITATTFGAPSGTVLTSRDRGWSLTWDKQPSWNQASHDEKNR